MIGQTLSHYRITSRLGEGGMGEVYRAEDTRLGREVALKVLPAEMAADPERLARFQREARALAALDHPNIVSVYSVEEDEGVHFLTMSLIEGETLDASIVAGGLPLARLLALASGMAEAIAAAHEKGIVHRDLKPGNVMVGPDGRVTVLDFGLSKPVESPLAMEEETVLASDDDEASDPELPTRTAALTRQGTIMGTVPYMSPEQIEGKPVDHRSDIFSLGVLLYELATGERPFQGDSSPGLMSSILKDEPVSVMEARTDLGSGIGELISCTLRKAPEERFQSARELLAELEPVRREFESGSIAQPAAPARRRFRWPLIVTAVVAVAAIVTGALLWAPEPVDEIDSLAVLPFENAGGDPDAEYFSDGVTETIISSLSQLPDMKVISRTSAFHYKGRQIDPMTVGQELDVDALVLGRVVQRGDDLVISAELVRSNDSGQIWGDRYQRAATDVFAIQEEIARQISSALRLELTSAESDRVTKQHTVNPDAYKAYLQGRHHWALRSREGFSRALEYFEEAISLDPEYALAYSGVADYYNLMGYYGAPPNESLPRALAAASRALELDPMLAEAHTSLAWVQMAYQRDIPAARASFERAIQLNPSYATAHHWSTIEHLIRNGVGGSAELLARALKLDPMSRIINSEYANWLAMEGRFEESNRQFERTLEIDAEFPQAFTRRTLSLVWQGRYEEAIESARKAAALLQDPQGLGNLGWAYAKAGRREDALDVLVQLEEAAGTTFVSRVHLASIHAALGDLDKAFELLEEAIEERHLDLLLVPYLYGGDFKDDPRLEEFVQRLGLDWFGVGF